MKNLISWTLIVSQFALMPAGFCAAPANSNSASTPEKALLTKVIAWSGDDLSNEQWQQRMRGALTDYAASSQIAGRDQRFEQALVDLDLYTLTQAQALMSEASAAGARLAANGVAPAQLAVQSELGQLFRQLLRTMPEGAQFSACGTPDTVMEIAGAAGSLAGIIGLWTQGSAVSASNWAGISVLSGISLLIAGFTISLSCGSN